MFLVISGLCLIFVNPVQSGFFVASQRGERVKKSTNYAIPWVGFLQFKHFEHKSEVVTGAVLIARRFALGNANDVERIEKRTIKNTTRITFFLGDDLSWDSTVTDYFLHPEFDLNTTNTLALLQLDTSQNIPFMLHPIKWSQDFYSRANDENIFIVGFTDRRKLLEQQISSMYPIDNESCKDFYVKKQLDFKMMWPTHFNCFIERNTHDTCVYDSGMAIASNNSGYWTLIGLSTYGPGCSLPSRFIEFFPYVPWVNDIILRSQKPTGVKHTRRYDWKFEPGEDSDTTLLAKLNDDTITLLIDQANVEMDVYGNCSKKRYDLMYEEEGYFRVNNLFRPNTVFYSVSLWDFRFRRVGCIRSKVICQKKSKTEIYIRRGFGQEHIEPMIKYDVEKFTNGTIPRKILYVKGNYQMRERDITTTIWFKFQMYRSAEIKIQFFGTFGLPLRANFTSTTTTTTSTTRRPRSHATYQGMNVYHKNQG